jgi:hypothetical protein
VKQITPLSTFLEIESIFRNSQNPGKANPQIQFVPFPRTHLTKVQLPSLFTDAQILVFAFGLRLDLFYLIK